MNNFFIRAGLLLFFLVLTACSGLQKQETVAARSSLLQATGYSDIQPLAHLTAVQNKFATEQDATINAYRKLAKQLYQLKLSNGVSVAQKVVSQDDFRVYLDLFLREARVESSSKQLGRQKVVLGLLVNPRFHYCLSSQQRVRACLLEDDKMPFTRLGYQRVESNIVNLACVDCYTQLSVAGFADNRNQIDHAMLNYGLYDSGWLANMATSVLIRYWFLTQWVFN